jgi:hypothetical protein
VTNRRSTRSYAALIDQRDALLRSIEDLERELAAGDLESEAFGDLHSTYVRRTAEVLRAIEASEKVLDSSEQVASRPSSWARVRRLLGRRRVRFVFGVVATICMLGAVGIVAAMLSGVRLPGQGETGGVVIPQSAQIAQDLARASALGSLGKVTQAIQLYDAVLKDVPNQPEALTYKGWLERLAGRAESAPGLVELGDAFLARAAKVAPRYADARGLYGIALLEDGGGKSVPGALREFRAFVRTKNNSVVLVAQGATMAAAFSASHNAVPAVLKPFLRSGATPSGTSAKL